MYLIQSVHNTILKWQINRPDRANGLGLTLATELMTELVRLKAKFEILQPQDYPYRMLILCATTSGKNQDVWIAGGDLKELMQLKEPKDAQVYAETMTHVCNILESLPIPVIAFIDGQAIGGGLELALAADIRVGTQKTRLEFKQLKVGLTTGYGSCLRLLDIIGYSKTINFLISGTSVSAEQALTLGLLNYLSQEPKQDQLLLDKICQQILEMSPIAITTQKQMLLHAKNHKNTDNQQFELDKFTSIWRNPDHENFLATFNKPQGN